MTFLAPTLLFALPLAALPVVIHLIHLYRRRQVKWAAMMFLRMAQRMNQGLSRLRQILILAFRVLAVAAILFVITRPMAGGLLGLTGGVPDTVIVLLDRSASMEQQDLTSGTSKRIAGLAKLSQALRDTVGTRSKLVLIENAHLQPQVLEKPESLVDLPITAPTDTSADVPALLQSALDYITTNQTGRTDVWVLSDLHESDWDVSSGRWQSLRSGFTNLKGVRFHLLNYAQPDMQNLSISIERVKRHETAEKAELLFDVRITRSETAKEPLKLPLRFVIGDVSTTFQTEMRDSMLILQAHAIPIAKTMKEGHGRIELPTDTVPSDNVFHFVFAEPAVLRSVIVSDEETTFRPLQVALEAAVDPMQKYSCSILPPSRAAEIAWDETALVIWHAPLPKEGDLIAKQLSHARSTLFLPPEMPNTNTFADLKWGRWNGSSKPQKVSWWRNDAELLANTRSGDALPLGDLDVLRHCEIIGEGSPLAQIGENQNLLIRANTTNENPAWFLGTLPSSDASTLARDGVAMFAMLHRALNEGSKGLGKAQQREAGPNALGPGEWKRHGEAILSTELPLRAGILQRGDRLVALNRPAREDTPDILARNSLGELFAGLDHQIIEDKIENQTGLASEIWRTFLFLMAIALLGEAMLCMPSKSQLPLAGA